MTGVRDDPVTWIARKGLPLVALGGTLVLAILVSTDGLTNDDTFFHLLVGDKFLTGSWSIWHPGSMTSHGTRDWVPTQWVGELVMAAVERAVGTRAVAWLAGTAIIGYALTLYVVCRRFAPPLVATVVVLTAFMASAQGLSARPQVFSYLFATLMTAAWLSTARDGKVRWWIIPVTWLWATLHGMWPVAVVIAGVGACAVILERRPDRRQFLHLLSVAPLSLGAACLTPLGPRLAIEVVTVTSRGKYFSEWGPTDFHSFAPMALVAIIAAALLVLLRSGPTPWTQTLLLLLAGAWAIYAVRTVPLSAAIAAPCAALALAQLVPAAAALDRRGRAALVMTGVVASLAVAGFAGGKPVGPARSDWANPELDQLAAGTTVLNAWEWGGYLAWRHPDLDFVISGFGDMYTTDELDRNVALTKTKSGWLDDLKSTGAEVALLEPDSELAYGLEHTAGWTVVRSSDEMVLLHAPE